MGNPLGAQHCIPDAASHVATHDGTDTVRRGGLHKKVASDIDSKLWNGVFDFEALTMWVDAKKFEYETPVNFARNAFVKLYDGLKTDDEKEASLYSYRAFQYVVWNRKIRALYDMRAKVYAEVRARTENADEDAAEDESPLE